MVKLCCKILAGEVVMYDDVVGVDCNFVKMFDFPLSRQTVLFSSGLAFVLMAPQLCSELISEHSFLFQ